MSGPSTEGKGTSYSAKQINDINLSVRLDVSIEIEELYWGRNAKAEWKWKLLLVKRRSGLEPSPRSRATTPLVC